LVAFESGHRLWSYHARDAAAGWPAALGVELGPATAGLSPNSGWGATAWGGFVTIPLVREWSADVARSIEAVKPSMVSLTLPHGWTTVGPRAAVRMGSLLRLRIPSTVESIGEWAFAQCSGVRAVTVPPRVTKLGLGAFSNCTSLVRVSMPSAVKCIPECCFDECPRLTHIVVPLGVTRIGKHAFGRELVAVSLPASLCVIDGWAFAWCSKLVSTCDS
jgi:hypothetical protein